MMEFFKGFLVFVCFVLYFVYDFSNNKVRRISRD